MPNVQEKNTVVIRGQAWSWAELLARFWSADRAKDLERALLPLALIGSNPLDIFGAVAAMAEFDLDAMVLGPERLSPSVLERLDRSGFARVHLPAGEIEIPTQQTRYVPGRVSLLTSGSTGTPKLVSHRWRTLFTASEVKRVVDHRWLVPYQVGTYAWFQLITPGLFHPGQTLVIAPPGDFEQIVRYAARHKVDSLSATPTFWRLALLQVPEETIRDLPLTTIVLGGELADQAILDRLRRLFPNAQITHIYASTEAGSCIVVKDGRAGFPAAWLTRNVPGLPSLKLEQGRLWIQSRYSAGAAEGNPEVWIDSGDCIEVRDGRAYFVGRANTALINVGGNKAYPADIEAVLLGHPRVRWCRVRAIRSPLVGNLAEADVVADGDPQSLEAELTQHCAAQLPEYAVPRIWNSLSAIPVEPSLKSNF